MTEDLNTLVDTANQDEQDAVAEAGRVLRERREQNESRARMRVTIHETRMKLGLSGDATDDEVLRILEKQPDVGLDLKTGTVYVRGHQSDLSEVLPGLWRRNNWPLEYRAEIAPRDKRYNGIESKADLKTFKEKSDFISRFGSTAYDALPLTSIPKGDLLKLHPAELMKLPPSIKSKLIARVGAKNWERLLGGQGIEQ